MKRKLQKNNKSLTEKGNLCFWYVAGTLLCKFVAPHPYLSDFLSRLVSILAPGFYAFTTPAGCVAPIHPSLSNLLSWHISTLVPDFYAYNTLSLQISYQLIFFSRWMKNGLCRRQKINCSKISRQTTTVVANNNNDNCNDDNAHNNNNL